MKSRIAWITMAVLGVLAAGCSAKHTAGGSSSQSRVEISVTEKGFEPAVVTVPAGKPVTLVVTRKTDKTCATEFVMASQGIRKDLPLDRPVVITFTAQEAGDLRYACGMDMILGTVRVE